jgi:hypothetical protein
LWENHSSRTGAHKQSSGTTDTDRGVVRG